MDANFGIITLAMLLLATAALSPRAATAGDSVLVRREVIAVYDGRYEREPHSSRIHKYVEMPLNYLGYTVTYVDVEKGLPEAAALQRAAAVLTYFDRPLSKPEAYVRWALAAAGQGLKIVIIGNTGAGSTEEEVALFNTVLGHIGLNDTGDAVNATFRSKPVVVDPDVVEFELKLDPVIPAFEVMKPVKSDVRQHLTMATLKGATRIESVLIATSPRGGIAADAFAVVYEPLRDRAKWVLNPFEFLRLALGDEPMPIPDVTTHMGRRIYFSHIDGDGWNNITEIERYRGTNTLSSEVVLREFIAAYPDLPVTVALVGGDVDPEIGGDPQAVPIAKQLFALPQVEVASHTYTHPYNWYFFEKYSREAEIALIDKRGSVERRLYDRAIGELLRLARKEKPRHAHQKYIAGSADLPRSYMRRPFDLELEVEGSLRVAESFAPRGKIAMLYQWSGDTTPFEEAVAATRRAGVRNINGGDSRLDAEYPSIVYVPPISRPAGKERQIYAVNSNENTYTNDWTGPYYGFKRLTETLENTEQPRRLKAFNLYYHMYSGEKPAARDAVRSHLELARKSDVVPIAASRYAAIADAFFDTEIRQMKPRQWRVLKRGDLQTVRFERAPRLTVDYADSRGVLGHQRKDDVLYVTLDADVEEPVVALADYDPLRRQPRIVAPPVDLPAPDAELSHSPLVGPYLVDSRWSVSRLQRSECGFSAVAEGFGPGVMTWSGLPPQAPVKIAAKRGDSVLWEGETRPDASGTLKFSINAVAIEPLTIEAKCTITN